MTDFLELCHLAAITMARAIGRGVHAADALELSGAQASWKDRWGS